MTRLILIGSFILIFSAGVVRAEDYFSSDYNGPRPPEDLLSSYARFVGAARKGDADIIKSLLLPGVAEITSTPREPNSRQYGLDINLPYLREGFSSALFAAQSDGSSQWRLKTGTTTIFFAKLESVGWRIYRYIDKPLK